MKLRTTIAVGVAACLLAAVPAAAQERSAILQAIPGDAVGFVVVNGLDKVSGKIAKLGGKLKLPVLVPPLQLLKITTGIQKGLDDKGSLGVAVLVNDDRPAVVVLIPVTAYKEFIDNFKAKDAGDKISEITIMGKTHYVGRKGDYAVLADEDTGKDLLKKVLDSSTGISGAVKGVEAWMAKTDAAGVLTPSGLKLIITKVREGLDQVKAITASLPPEMQAVVNLIDGLDNFLKSAETEVTHIVIGGRIDAAANIELASKFVFAPSGKFADAGAKFKASEAGPLAGLPGGPFVVAGGGAFPGKLMMDITRFSVDMIKLVAKDVGEEQFKKLDDAYKLSLKGLRGMAVEIRVGKPGQPLLHNVVYAADADDAAAYLAGSEKAIRAMNDIFKDANIPFYKPVEIKKVKVGTTRALETITDLGDNPGINLLPPSLAELLFGKENKITTSMAAAGKERVLARYSPASGLKRVVDASTKLADDPSVVQTTALLPKGHQWALYISPKGVVDTVKQVHAALDEKRDLPAFPDTPPVGIGVKLSAAGLEGRLVVPAQVLEGAGTLIPHIMKKLMNAPE
jgi:hypothetical protein